MNCEDQEFVQLLFRPPFRPYTEAEIEQRRAAGRKRAEAFTPEYQSQAGKKLVEQRGPKYMSEIGSAGYFECGARHGWSFVNEKVFGKHLTKRQAYKQRHEKLKVEVTD